MNTGTRNRIVMASIDPVWAEGFQSTSIADILSRNRPFASTRKGRRTIDANWLPVAAAASSLLLLLGKLWQRLGRIRNVELAKCPAALVFGGGIVLFLVAVVAVAMIIDRDPGLGFATAAGLGVELC